MVHGLEDVLVPELSRKHRVVQRRAVAYCSTGLVILAVPNGTLGLVLDAVNDVAAVLFPKLLKKYGKASGRARQVTLFAPVLPRIEELVTDLLSWREVHLSCGPLTA